MLKKTEGNCKLIITVICICLVNSVYSLTSRVDPSLKHARCKSEKSVKPQRKTAVIHKRCHAKDGAGWWDRKQRTEMGMAYLRLGKNSFTRRKFTIFANKIVGDKSISDLVTLSVHWTVNYVLCHFIHWNCWKTESAPSSCEHLKMSSIVSWIL